MAIRLAFDRDQTTWPAFSACPFQSARMRGSPNRSNAAMSKAVIALSRSPAAVSTQQAVGVSDGCNGIAVVRAECWLAVCPGGKKPEAMAPAEGDRREELRRRVPALVFERYRWHAHPGVFGQAGHDSGHICGLERLDESREKSLFLRRVRWRRSWCVG